MLRRSAGARIAAACILAAAAAVISPAMGHAQSGATPAGGAAAPAGGAPAPAKPAAKSAAPADEDDDPAFSRPAPGKPTPAAPATTTSPEEDPFPAPLPPEEEDPGFVPPPAAPKDLSLRRHATPPEPRGMRLRVSYRTWQLSEATLTSTKDDRFHSLSLDIYPISGQFRLGLAAQIAREGSDGDTFGTVGLAAGMQRPGRPWTPYGEAEAHVGIGQRTFCGNFGDVPSCRDLLTMLWGFGIEAGIDKHLFGKTIGTAALGIQRNQFFSVEVQDVRGDLGVVSDVTVTLKLGIGY